MEIPHKKMRIIPHFWGMMLSRKITGVGWGHLDPLSNPVIWSWWKHKPLQTSSASSENERVIWEDKHVSLITTLKDIHLKKKNTVVPCENLEGTMRTVGPQHLVFWGDSGRALSDASHTWCTAKSLQQMSSEWHGQSQRGTQAFYLSLTPFNPVEDDFGHRQQICWTWAQQGSKTFSTSQSQAGNVIGFIFRSLYEGVSVVKGTWWWCENAKRPIWGSETLISLYLLK